MKLIEKLTMLYNEGFLTKVRYKVFHHSNGNTTNYLADNDEVFALCVKQTSSAHKTIFTFCKSHDIPMINVDNDEFSIEEFYNFKEQV